MTSNTSVSDETKAAKPLQPPVDKGKYDLTCQPKLVKDPTKKPPIDRSATAWKSPAAMMREMGFAPHSGDLTPLQFLVAVMNEDVDKLYRQEKKRNMMRGKGIGMNYRIEAAKTAAKFMHMAAPQVQIRTESEDKFGDELAEKLAKGNHRVQTRRVIMETVEEISPDLPLPEASYPPAFENVIEGTIVDGNGKDLNPEGNTNYDPDREG